MPIHDWTRVPAGVFHAFHHDWVTAISRVLNGRALPGDHYALPEQDAGGYGPDVFTLRLRGTAGVGGPQTMPPPTRFTATAPSDTARKRKSRVAVKHVSRDETVAVVEVVSPGNKDGRHAFRTFVDKAADLIERRIHLLVIDLFPPGPRDPDGVHAAIWGEVANQDFSPPDDKPLTLVAYEAAFPARAYIEPVAVGDPLADTPLFLVPGQFVSVPLEATYRTVWEGFPLRWREVIEGIGPPEAADAD